MRNPLGPDTSAFLDDVEESTKVKAVMEICEKVKNNKRSDGECSKVVIASAKPWSVTELLWRITKKYGKGHVVAITATQSAQEKLEAIEKLQNDDNVWVAVCSLGSVGTGVELQRADHIVLFDLTHEWKTVVQLGGRIDRRSQHAKQCFFYMLYNSASSFDRSMHQSLLFKMRAEQAMMAQSVREGPVVYAKWY
ncbi:hypothetical protein LTS18_006906 [Coniosporium uncinatum]|uniref:Uncharacterized protein n=1 Tax=Coniosporium uncinatum TaxID=93489 RepID=A0ACC3DZQ9_9PEZI|nr:hypothetical protein LTS18_006906 [Coniosporium uncinatum]